MEPCAPESRSREVARKERTSKDLTCILPMLKIQKLAQPDGRP